MKSGIVIACVGMVASVANAGTGDPATFFESRVRPVLVEKCFDCHGEKLQRSGLRLDSQAGMLKGGARGAALIAGQPSHSRMIEAIRQRGELKMPPSGKLSDDEIAALTQWVQMGAVWPQARMQDAGMSDGCVGQGGHWAFRSIANPPLPRVKNSSWVKRPLDAFILSELEKLGLQPAPPAAKRALIRRATFDLIGLPPTPEKVAAFIADTSPGAFARVVERLLESPRYGERWGRHWLDCARFADSNGMDENYHWANAWRYRDYVIDAINRDTPFDRFIIEQLAGDLLADRLVANQPTSQAANDHERYRLITATGFLMIGPKLIANPDKAKVALDIIDEQIDTTGRAFLAMTLGCARCHDHKFDPIAQREYYAMAGVFKSTTVITDFIQRTWLERPLAPAAMVAQATEHQKRMEAMKKSVDDAKKKKADMTTLARLQSELDRLQKTAPTAVPYAMAVQDGKLTELPLLTRGNHNAPSGDPVPRAVPAAMCGGERPAFPTSSSGRLELAHWIASPRNPLTARVMMNRVWQWHFGQGLSRTPDNFGRLGERPSHPALLDHLATRFLSDGWSLKAMHREIMGSSAYQMSTAFEVRGMRADPENRLLWRMNRQRLDAESLRDAILSISGALDLAGGGTLLGDVPNMQRVTTDQSEDFAQKAYALPRRSVYLPVIRNSLFAMFDLFDVADPSAVTPRRNETIVAPQALFILNNPLMLEYARRFAESLIQFAGDDAARVNAAYQRCFQRAPAAEELAEALAFVRSQSAVFRNRPDASTRAWQTFCQALFASNEFAYGD